MAGQTNDQTLPASLPAIERHARASSDFRVVACRLCVLVLALALFTFWTRESGETNFNFAFCPQNQTHMLLDRPGCICRLSLMLCPAQCTLKSTRNCRDGAHRLPIPTDHSHPSHAPAPAAASSSFLTNGRSIYATQRNAPDLT